MAKKQILFKTKGMNQDLSASAFNPEFAFENRNLRLSTNEGNTLMSWVNEKGTSLLEVSITKAWDTSAPAEIEIKGIPIGTAIIEQQLVLFTTETVDDSLNTDRIYVLQYDEGNNSMSGVLLYEGHLNFSVTNPFETLVSYEAGHIQKVYWVDGINQPRIINIKADSEKVATWHHNPLTNDIDSFFDFVPSSDLNASITVAKRSGVGLFAPGVIQYCFTFINKYGQQTNIVDVSPLNYLSHPDRGASPEDKVSGSFEISIETTATDFDYIRLYSIQRTSLDAEPLVKILADMPIGTNTFVDNGTTGATIDPMELLYVGGKEIHALTMAEKDNTLFLGNIEEPENSYNQLQDYFDSIRGKQSAVEITYYQDDINKTINLKEGAEVYPYINGLKDNDAAHLTSFKKGDYYRFGFQLQRKTGEWTDPIYIDDKAADNYPSSFVYQDYVRLISAKADINLTPFSATDSRFYIPDFHKKYKNIRPVIVYPDIVDRTVLCQGVLNPTVFNTQDRIDGTPYAQPSWFFRPYTAEEEPVNYYDISDTAVTPTDLENYYTTPVIAILIENYEGNLRAESIEITYYNDANLQSTAICNLPVYRILQENNKTIYIFKYDSNSDPIISAAHKIRSLKLHFLIGEPTTIDDTDYTIEFTQDLFRIYSSLFVSGNPYKVYYSRTGNSTLPSTYILKIDFRLIRAGNIDTYYIKFYEVLSTEEGNTLTFKHYDSLPSEEGIGRTNISKILGGKRVEIQGAEKIYDNPFSQRNNNNSNTQFFVDQSIVTMHSPDIEFDTDVQNYSMDDLKLRIVGAVPITANVSSHTIQHSAMLEFNHGTSYPSTSFGDGELDYNVLFNNKDVKAYKRLVSAYLWNDALVQSAPDAASGDGVVTAPKAYDFLTYPWHRNGSLNNDFRNNNVASSVLKTKKIGNLLFSYASEYLVDSNHKYISDDYLNISAQIALTENSVVYNIRLPKQTELSSSINYYPNIDKVLFNQDGYYPTTKISSDDIGQGVPWYQVIGKVYTPVSMRYKSTSHAVISLNTEEGASGVSILPAANNGDGNIWGNYSIPESTSTFWGDQLRFEQRKISIAELFEESGIHREFGLLWLAELYKDVYADTIFGGNSREAIKNNKWVIGGEAVAIPAPNEDQTVTLVWTHGDTYYQRYDCLKTYPFTNEDTNQMVEILSFMCETHINLDGRYDRNRGQYITYNSNPTNFNLLNPVYNQKDNFFTSKIIGTDKNASQHYPNLVYYTKTKESGADVDLWTNVTLGSMLELDGDKGSINKLSRLDDKLLCFQDSGISQILYNENVQISTENGVPIELANSGKVQGKKYLSNSIGCSNKWSVVNTPLGIYFMDSNNKSIYRLGSQGMENLSQVNGLDSWCKQHIPAVEITALGKRKTWTPDEFKDFVAYYDKQNQDVLFINDEEALAFSEKFGCFTSFYDYGNTPYLCNLDDTSIWLKDSKLWKHQSGDYCNFFGVNKPYWMTLVGNPEPQMDKIFTNLEFRACVDGDMTTEVNPVALLPFDFLETWDEYQHGYTTLENKNGHSMFRHGGNDSALIRKYRIWRCDIPRDNFEFKTYPIQEQGETEAYYQERVDVYNTWLHGEHAKGIYRYGKHVNDRMRNPWLYLQLMKNVPDSGVLPRSEIHDVVMTYYS